LTRVAYYKGCLASLSAKELDTSTRALAPRVGLQLGLEIRRRLAGQLPVLF
jgi:heterodisulfide reductase subunit B